MATFTGVTLAPVWESGGIVAPPGESITSSGDSLYITRNSLSDYGAQYSWPQGWSLRVQASITSTDVAFRTNPAAPGYNWRRSEGESFAGLRLCIAPKSDPCNRHYLYGPNAKLAGSWDHTFNLAPSVSGAPSATENSWPFGNFGDETDFIITVQIIQGLQSSFRQTSDGPVYWDVGNQAYYWSHLSPYQCSSGVPIEEPGRVIILERWFTVHINRTPSSPIITEPTTNIAVPYADGVNSWFMIEWDHNDLDSVDDNTPENDDYAGWQVQYRPAPTTADPSPAWSDYDIKVLDPGDSTYKDWRSFQVKNMSPSGPYAPSVLAAEDYQTWMFASDEDPTPYLSGKDSYGIIEPGTYQFRARTFDYSSYFFSSNRITLSPPRLNPKPGGFSPWSTPVTVIVNAPFLNPIPLSPDNQVALWASTIPFTWRFRDPRPTGGAQDSRQIFVRKVGDSSYTELIPSGETESDEEFFNYVNGSNGFTFEPGFQYEWRVKTIAVPGDYESGMSRSAFFWYIPAPGSGGVLPAPGSSYPSSALGCGVNRAFLFRRGGTMPLGEITNTTKIQWGRLRDDVSAAEVSVSMQTMSEDCAALLSIARSWMHEIVIFRDMGNGPERVWEGPITRINYTSDGVDLAARDVMAWPYRRILRQGYNDAYRPNGTGLTKVTIRSAQIIQNALAYDDPNVLAYMTIFEQANDARQSRIVPDYSRTAWQEVDDLGAKAGLDYTTVGRRIVLWDTHVAIGVLPEMRDGDFDQDPVVTEYGMQAANVYGVTNNNGIYGLADRLSDPLIDEYGIIEMLSSAYGEDDEAGSDLTLTQEARERLEQTLAEQAERNISGRWPVPVIVRVPDNSTLNPDLEVGINQLIPGVHIPLRSESTLRKVSQLQKLDSVTVIQDSSGEKVQVVMSPAPVAGQDPDEGGEEE